MKISILKKYYAWLAVLFISCVLTYVSSGLSLDLSDFELQHNGVQETVKLPLSKTSRLEGGKYELHGKIAFGWWASKILHITPDDRVTQIVINGTKIDLSHISEESLSDWSNGFTLNAEPYVTEGHNSISIAFIDYGGNGLMGMKIQPRLAGWKTLVISVFWLSLIFIALMMARPAGIPKWHLALYFLIVLGAVLQIWTIYTYNPMDHVWSDAQRHWEQGTETLRSDLMSNADPIMYQLYIGALAKLSLGLPGLVAFFTSLLAVLTPWLWYRFFRELQSNKTLALAGWAFLSLLPSWMSIYTYFMQETLLLPLLGAALWATWRARRKGTTTSFALMVILWILAGLTRGIAIPLAAVSCTALWLTQEHRLKKVLVSACILSLTLGPLTYRSYQTVNHFAPHGMGHIASIYARSGNKEITLHIPARDRGPTYGFGSPSTGEKPFAPISDWETRRQGVIVVDVDLEKGREDWEKAYQQAAMTWDEALWIVKENLIFLFFGSSWPDNNESRLLDRISIHMRWIWAPAFLAAIIWTFMIRRRLRHQWLLPSLIAVWFIVQGLFVISLNEGRYRKPFEGLIVAQFILLAGASRGQTKSGRPYCWDFGPFLNGLALKVSTSITDHKRPADAEPPAQKDFNDQPNSSFDQQPYASPQATPGAGPET